MDRTELVGPLPSALGTRNHSYKTLYVLETYVIRMDWFSRSAKGKNKIGLLAI